MILVEVREGDARMTVVKIEDNLYLGDWEDAKNTNYPELDKITVSKDSPYIGDYYFPIVDDKYSENSKLILFAAERVRLSTDEGYRVLVSCTSGISRSTTVIAAYFIIYCSRSLDDSLKMIQKVKPICNPSPPLRDILVRLEEFVNG